MDKVGFVGVGRMGANMARRWHSQGGVISAIFDINTEAAKALAAELGAPFCATLAEVTQPSDVILTVVTDDKAMKDIYNGGLLHRCRGKLFINCATLSPATHVWVQTKTAARGALSLEACMASSITQAREGTLYLMCAGTEPAFARAKSILDKMASSVRYIGPAGTAAQVKALVNMVMNINTAGLAEGLGLGAALGLDLTMLREVFAQTGANSRVLETDGADMQNRDHACFFSAAHAAKDSGIALRLAREAGLTLPVAKASKQQFDRMVAEGLGELDKSGVAELTFKDRHAAPPAGK